MPLTEKELEQIREEAERLYPYPKDEDKFMARAFVKAQREAHIAAVTAERERAKVLVDAAKDICKKLEPLLPESILSSIYKTLSNALKQYEQ